MLEKELIEFFLTEAEEHITQLEKGFLDLDQNPSATSGLQELFRTAHTLKGSAALVKLKTLSKIAHKMEDVLESIKDGQVKATKGIVDWFLLCLDSIKYLIEEVANGRPEKVELADEVCSVLHTAFPELAGDDIIAAASASVKEPAEADPVGTLEEVHEGEASAEAALEDETIPVNEKVLEELNTLTGTTEEAGKKSTFVKVHIEKLDRMMGLVGELTILKNFFVSEAEGAGGLRTEIDYACARLVKEIEEFDSRYAQAAPEKMSYVDTLLEDFRELEFDRYDGINLFANSIKEIMSDVSEAVKSISGYFDQFSKHTNKLGKLNTEFRDIISESRMVETGMLFSRFTRIVRDLSDQSGKIIRLDINGGHTTIDRILYERLFTPLLHLVRNAFSHGIESPGDRLALDKAEEGSIALSATRDGNSIVIDVQDNGRGIDLEKVRRRAVTMGIITNGEDVSKVRLMNILFMPGFSTHDEIDMTSGRGVGLDVVRQIISEMNGTLSIATEDGKGTTFRIKLPLTLLVVNTVKFRSAGLEFSVPSSLIQELIEIDAAQYEKQPDLVELRGNEVPLKDLCGLLNLNGERGGTKYPAIIFNLLSGRKTALLVDEIIGQEDTVINPIGGFLEGLRYYSGFSISADAKLAPVINPIGLLEAQIEQVEILEVPKAEELRNRILVVDDSLSVRKFASILLEQNGYNVLTASNGLEALTVIEDNHVDLIMTDLEMPVMHGYELLKELKRRGIAEIIPSVVLTSRNSDKHKEKALEHGARDYLVKPFEESSLLETVRRHIKAGIVIPAL